MNTSEVTDKKVLEFKDLDEDKFVLVLSDYKGINYFRFINAKINEIRLGFGEDFSVEIVDSEINTIRGESIKKLKLVNSHVVDINMMSVTIIKSRNSKIENEIKLFGTKHVDIESNKIYLSSHHNLINIISVGNLNVFACGNVKINIRSFKELNIKILKILPYEDFNDIIAKLELECDLDNFNLQNLYSIKKILEIKKVIPVNFDENEIDERIMILKNMNKSKSAIF